MPNREYSNSGEASVQLRIAQPCIAAVLQAHRHGGLCFWFSYFGIRAAHVLKFNVFRLQKRRNGRELRAALIAAAILLFGRLKWTVCGLWSWSLGLNFKFCPPAFSMYIYVCVCICVIWPYGHKMP